MSTGTKQGGRKKDVVQGNLYILVTELKLPRLGNELKLCKPMLLWTKLNLKKLKLKFKKF